MGLLRSFAKKVVARVTGGPVAPRPGAPAAAAPTSAAPTSAAGPVVSNTPDADPVIENADSLSTIECSAQEIKERVGAGEPVTILDVREPHETAGGIIPGAIRIPLGQLRARWEEVKDANEIVCYCAMGARSLQAAQFLREKGLFNATSMDGGISAWTECAGPIVVPG